MYNCQNCRDVGFTQYSISYQSYGVSDKTFCTECGKGRQLYLKWTKEPAPQAHFREWKQEKIERALKLSGVDGIFKNRRLSDLKKDSSLAQSCQKYVENWEEIKRQGFGFYFWGNVGAGKTYAATALANELMEKRLVEVLFIRMPEAIARVKKSFSSEMKTPDSQLFDRMRDEELLIIDDLGVEKVSDWLLDQMYQIVDYRWRNQKPMIITSNQSLQDLGKIYQEQIVSRLRGCCKQVQFSVSDRRKSPPTLF